MSSSAYSAGRGRWRAHLSLARISNSPTVVTNALAGAALAGGLSGGAPWPVWLVAAATTLFYTAGMYLNDLLDLEIDRCERPGRPLPSGLIRLPEAWAVTLALFVLGELLLLRVGNAAALSGLALIALIVVYDAWHKTNPLSPLLMAGTRALVYVTAALAFTPSPSPALWIWALLLGGYVAGLTSVAKTEHRPGAARYWPVALLAAPVAYGLLGGFGWPAAFAALLLGGWIIHSLGFVHGPQRNIGGAVGRLIAGCCLLDLLVLSAAGAVAWAPLALAAFALTLYWQRFIKGT